jgi:hypothetical protein
MKSGLLVNSEEILNYYKSIKDFSFTPKLFIAGTSKKDGKTRFIRHVIDAKTFEDFATELNRWLDAEIVSDCIVCR